MKSMSSPSAPLDYPLALLREDVIDAVLEQLYRWDERATLVASMLVHSTWTCSATRWLWRDIPSLRVLMLIIGPITYRDDKPYWEFEASTPIADAQRVRFYARYIHTLGYARPRYHRMGIEADTACPTSFVYLASIASEGSCLFPNLRALVWTSSTAFTGDQLRFMASRSVSPNIHTLFLYTTWQELDKFTLSTLTDLHLTSFDFLINQSLRRTPGGIASIVDTFIASQPQLKRLSLSQGELYNLDSRYVHTVVPNPFIRHPSSSCQLWMRFWTADEPITFNALESLIRSTDLIEFRLSTVLQHPMTEVHVGIMAAAWPSLTILSLHHGGMGRPMMQFSILPTLVQEFPLLQTLSVSLAVDSPSLQDFTAVGKFPSLKKLDFGASYIPKERVADVVPFLVAICPEDVEIGATGVCWKRWERVVALVEEVYEWQPQARVN